MATFNNGESGASVRTKINEAIDKVDGNSAFDNDIDVNGNVSIGDNYQIRLGASNDLTIEHNATNGVITNNTNNLYLANKANDKDVYIQTDNGSGDITNYFVADGSTGEAKMYYYGSPKVTTTSTGARISGTLDVTGNITLGDNDQLRLGDSSDVIIQHNSTFGDILNQTGVLAIRNTADNQDVVIQTDDGSGSVADYFRADGSTGETQLFYYGAEKLNTTSSGVDISGGLTTNDEVTAKVVTYAANQNAPYMIAATTSYTGATTNVGTYGLQHRFKFDSGGSPRITVDGAIGGVATELWALYGGTGNMDVYGSLDVGGNVSLGDNDELRFGDSSDLILEHNGSNGDIRNSTNDLLIRNLADDRDVNIQCDDGSGGTATYFKADGSTGEAQLFYYGSEKLNTQSGGVDITGTVTPDSLEVFSNSNTPLANVKFGRDSGQYIDFHGGSAGNYMTSESSSSNPKPLILSATAGTTIAYFTFHSNGNLDVPGALSKGSGSFKIDHPLKPTSHHLVHSFVEAPQADNIYRGKVALVDGSATVNLDEAGRMTEGTFVALNGNIQCFTTNEDGWTAVRGSVSGNTLTIEAQDSTCADTVSWLVIGERHDPHMLDTDWTDAAGRVITEPEKQTEEDE